MDQEARYHRTVMELAQLAWRNGNGDELLRAARKVALEPSVNSPTMVLPIIPQAPSPALVRPFVRR